MRICTFALLGLVGCTSDDPSYLPSGWEESEPVLAFEQADCPVGGGYPEPERVEADLASDPLHVDAYAIDFRCGQAVEGYWKEADGEVDVLVQPIDMLPETTAKCDCTHDLSIDVASFAAAPDGVTLWKRFDGSLDADPRLVGKASEPE